MEPKKSFFSQDKESQPPGRESLFQKRSFFMPKKGLLPFYPQYFEEAVPSKLQRFYTSNGHLSLLKSLQITVASNIQECRYLWQKFSPQKTLFDTWSFRFAFWKGYRHSPYFLLLKNQTENFALLPLWYEKEKKKYFWFGSAWQEENSFFVKDPIFVPLLFAVCPSPLLLNAISLQTVSWAREYINFSPDDPKYVLDLQIISSVDNFLSNLKKKKRYNLRRDKQTIERQNPQIVFNNFSDFETLVSLSKKRFAQKGEDTDWEDKRRVETFRQVIDLGKKNQDYQVRMITIKIGEKIAGVDLIALYKRCYYPLKCGYDVKNFPGIGNFVNLLEIEDALTLGMKKIDFLEIGYGWKQRFFQEIPLFQYEKK